MVRVSNHSAANARKRSSTIARRVRGRARAIDCNLATVPAVIAGHVADAVMDTKALSKWTRYSVRML